MQLTAEGIWRRSLKMWTAILVVFTIAFLVLLGLVMAGRVPLSSGTGFLLITLVGLAFTALLRVIVDLYQIQRSSRISDARPRHDLSNNRP